MIEKLSHSILIVVLLLSTTGMGFKSHYCLGEYRYTTISWLDIDCCDAELPMPLDCCHDTYEFVQLDTDLNTSAVMNLVPVALVPLLFPAQPNVSAPEIRTVSSSFAANPPPLLHPDIPVWVQSFRI